MNYATMEQDHLENILNFQQGDLVSRKLCFLQSEFYKLINELYDLRKLWLQEFHFANNFIETQNFNISDGELLLTSEFSNPSNVVGHLRGEYYRKFVQTKRALENLLSECPDLKSDKVYIGYCGSLLINVN